jgi:hypothetical protein
MSKKTIYLLIGGAIGIYRLINYILFKTELLNKDKEGSWNSCSQCHNNRWNGSATIKIQPEIEVKIRLWFLVKLFHSLSKDGVVKRRFIS